MFIVQFEYGLGSAGHTESCVGFDTMDEALRYLYTCLNFPLAAVNEICDKVQDCVKADNAIIRVWDAEVDDDLIANN